MSALRENQKSVPDKAAYGTVALCGAILVVALIYFLARAPNKSALADGGENSTTATLTNLLTPEEIEKQHAMYQPPVPATPAPVLPPPAGALTNQNADAIKLQQATAKVNRIIVERMKQYVRDNPNRDTRAIEKQIKKREMQSAPAQ